MNRSLTGLLSALLICSLGRLQGQETTLLKRLPQVPVAEGWVPDGQAQEFRGEDLYIYIDGGAEIYQEYGFTAVVVQDYRNAAGKSVSLELFEMSDDAAAYGMYTFKTSGKGEILNLGDGGQVEDYYLNFYKGRFVLTATGFDSSPETVRGLREVAEAANREIPGAGHPPALMGELPAGFETRSVKYVRGRLGLNNILPALAGTPLAFEGAVRGVYGAGAFYIIDCGGEAPAARAFESLETIFRAGGTAGDSRTTPGVLEVPGEKRGHLRVALFKSRLLMTTGLSSPDSDALMAAARSNLRAGSASK